MKQKKRKQKDSDFLATSEQLKSGDLLTPIKIEDIGSNGDPCFGKGYDLSTAECKVCGDSELCSIKTAASLGKTRKELEDSTKYKDLEDRIDKTGLKKYYRKLNRAGKTKKEILEAMQVKYEITRKEARTLYKEFNQS